MAEKEKDTDKEQEPKEGEESAGLEPPKKKMNMKLLIILGVAGVLLVGGGVTAALVMGGKEAKDKAESQEASKKPEEETAKDAKITFFPMGDLMVNLSGEGKRPNYLKVKISLELADAKDTSTIESLKPRLIDNFQTYLRELRIDDLRGSAGLYRLREALLLRANEVAQPARIRDVLFQEMLIQ